MSRAFSHAAGDFIAFSPGGAASLTGGGQTSLFLWKADAIGVAHGLIIGRNGTNGTVWGVNPYQDNRAYYTASSFSATDTIASGVWYLHGFTKAAGSAAVRSHFYSYTSSTWTHTNWGTLGDATTGPVAEMRLGWFSGTDILTGKIAAAALYTTVLTDLQIEGLTATFSSWMSLSPAWAVQLNQASVATAVTDQTAGGGNQSAISGTTVSADEPAGWTYLVPGVTVADVPGAARPGTATESLTLGVQVADSAIPARPGTTRELVDTGPNRDAPGAVRATAPVETVTANTGLEDPIVMPALRQLLACLASESTRQSSPPTHFRIIPGVGPVLALGGEDITGSTVVDECCEGVGYVRVINGPFATSEFPNEEPWYPDFPTSWGLVVQIGMLRCGGGPDINLAPSDAQWTAYTQAVEDDKATMRRAVCCLQNLINTPGGTIVQDVVYGPGRPEPVGSESNCMGSTVEITLQLPYCCQ